MSAHKTVVILLIGLAGVPLAAAAQTSARSLGPAWSARTSVVATATADDQVARNADAINASAASDGVESSPCTADELRRSRAESSASSSPPVVTDAGIQVAATVRALSHGGHFLTCAVCLGSSCIGKTGHDTRSTATAQVTIDVALRFPESFGTDTYELVLDGTAALSGASYYYAIRDPDGGLVAEGTNTIGSFTLIKARPNGVFTIQIVLSAVAEDAGGCCSKSATGRVGLSAAVRPAALLSTATKEQSPIIAGDMASVGLLLLRGVPHCVATLVASRAVVTASSCIQGFPVEDLTFAAGSPTNGQWPFNASIVGVRSAPVESQKRPVPDSAQGIALLMLNREAPFAPLAVREERIEPQTGGRPSRHWSLVSFSKDGQQQVQDISAASSPRPMNAGCDGILGAPAVSPGAGTSVASIITETIEHGCRLASLASMTSWLKGIQ